MTLNNPPINPPNNPPKKIIIFPFNKPFNNPFNKNTINSFNNTTNPVNITYRPHNKRTYRSLSVVPNIKKQCLEIKDLLPIEIIKIDKKIKSLSDLIELGKTYKLGKTYSIDLELLNKMLPALEDLNNMIGMKNIKKDIIDHIIFYLQKLDNSNKDMLHTVIEGPPGVGKTELGKILGRLYLQMGILKNNIFKKVSRTDMVGKYLGQTALKTEELINSCKGGVMFIDEVYSLGNIDQRDSFSKEAIDTLNLKLTEMKNDFVCIVAGYPREIDQCFFSYNIGLNSRFPIRFAIDPYTPFELSLIFKKIVTDNNWKVDDDLSLDFFKDNYDEFKNYGRDMESLFVKTKRAHSKRLYNDSTIARKLITNKDIEIGFQVFLLNKP